MLKLFNNKSQKELRRKLRNQGIASEKLLWKKLQKSKLGFKFRRQHGIGKFIVDFYCPKLKFIIELDGATHGEDREIKYDNKRQAYLEGLGFVVKRYLNVDVQNDMDLVVENIRTVCDGLSNP